MVLIYFVILDAFEKQLFSSLRDLAALPPPNRDSEGQHCSLSNPLLRHLRSFKHHSWQVTITVDET
jgi:hypothetical protein